MSYITITYAPKDRLDYNNSASVEIWVTPSNLLLAEPSLSWENTKH